MTKGAKKMRKNVDRNTTSTNDAVKSNNDSSTSSDANKIMSKSKKQKGFKEKKAVTGLSNWSLLCSQMKKDPCSRKKRIVKESGDSKDEGPPAKKPKQEIWFDDVDESLLESDSETTGKKKDTEIKNSVVPTSVKSLVKEKCFQGQTKCIGIDCEMVGAGEFGQENILARVSLVNVYGHCLYDKFVIPREPVTDYRTFVSGVTKELIDEKGEPFMTVQQEVSDLIQGAVLVGHALDNDLRVLYLTHPRRDIRDTSKYKPFKDLFDGKQPSLKKLTQKLLGVAVQEGEHSSVEDAQAAMRLYTMHKAKWEKFIKDARRFKQRRNVKSKKKKPSEEMEALEDSD